MIKAHSKAALAVILSLLLAAAAITGCSSSQPEQAAATPEPTAAPTAEPDPFAEERTAFDTAASLYYSDRVYTVKSGRIGTGGQQYYKVTSRYVPRLSKVKENYWS